MNKIIRAFTALILVSLLGVEVTLGQVKPLSLASGIPQVLPLGDDSQARDYLAGIITMLGVNVGQIQHGTPVFLVGVTGQMPSTPTLTGTDWTKFGNDVILGLIAQATKSSKYIPGVPLQVTAQLQRVELNLSGEMSIGLVVNKQSLSAAAKSSDIKWDYAYAGIPIVFRGIKSVTPIDVPAGFTVVAVPEEETVNFDKRLVGRHFRVRLTFSDDSVQEVINEPSSPLVSKISPGLNGPVLTVSGGRFNQPATLCMSSDLQGGQWSPVLHLDPWGASNTSILLPTGTNGFQFFYKIVQQ